LISRNDAADLLWYFSEGISTFERSPFGGMLERASVLSCDSDGEPIPTQDPSEWHVAPVKHQPAEPSYTPELETMVRVARISRRLSTIERADRLISTTLATYYGDLGARWAATPLGRLAAIYGLTDSGDSYLREVLKHDTTHVRPDDRIALLFIVSKDSKTSPDGQRCALIHAQAQTLLARAWKGWNDSE
jgi:hypothetical protein